MRVAGRTTWLVCAAATAWASVGLAACAPRSFEPASSATARVGDGSPPSDPARAARRSEGAASPAPSLPAAAIDQSDAGVEAFLRHYMALIDHGRTSGDWKPMKSASLPGCGNCAAYARTRGRVDGARWIPEAVTVTFQTGGRADPAHRSAQLRMRMPPGTWRSSPNARPKRVAEDNWTFHVEVEWRNEQWYVAHLRVIDR